MSIFKLIFAIIFDVIDCLIGRIPILGTVYDIFGTFLTFMLCGPMGLIYAWEIMDITDQLDGFIPTMTLVYIYTDSQTNAPSQEYMVRKKGMKGKKKSKKRAQ